MIQFPQTGAIDVVDQGVDGTPENLSFDIPQIPVVQTIGGGEGVTVHSLLSGRSDADQHPVSAITGLEAWQADIEAELQDLRGIDESLDSAIDAVVAALAGKAALSHSHTAAAISDLALVLANYASVIHGHTIADVGSLQATLDSKALADHSHDISDTTGLQTALDAKAASSHGHVISDVTGLQAALDAKAASGHTHTIANVTGLQAALDGKQAASANIRNIHIGTTAPVDTSFLWLDTN